MTHSQDFEPVKTPGSGYLQTAAIGGVFVGVLSALPFISALNACCCLWFVSGALIAAYFLQQNRQTPLTPGDGALVGLLAGVIGVVIRTVLSIPIDIAIGPMQRELVQRLMDSARTMSPEAQQFLEGFGDAGQLSLGAQILARVFEFVIFLFVGSIFSTLGGLLGAVIFSKRVTPLPSEGPVA